MVFSSTIFLFLFLPFTLVVYYLLDRKFKNFFLLMISLIFYAWGEPQFVFVMLLSIILNYGFAICVDNFRDNKRIARIVIFLMVLVNLAIFWIFKYMDFTIENLNFILGKNISLPNIALPIGISFFTFQAISYVIDVYRGKGSVQKNPLNVGLYISFFPQLIAGPIVRYETIANEIKCRRENWNDFCNGLEQFVIGLGKKVLLSNSLAIVADYCFNHIKVMEISVLMAWIGAISYTFQIYFDFSGYSDMAIGLGRMFGFHFIENFNYPYLARSVSDFWRRWHISLSSWFRDYVYIPLGGSRVCKGRHIFNLFVVWTLTGIWHGASWNFIIWGWFYFIILVIEKVTGIPDCFRSKIAKIGYRIITILAIILGWVLFRAENIEIAIMYIRNMFGLCGNALVERKTMYIIWDNKWILLAACFCSTPVFSMISKKMNTQILSECFEVVKYFILILIFVVSIFSVVSSSYNPFIYFNF